MTLSLKPTVLRLRRWNMRFVFFFNDTATTEIYTLSLHDALPISGSSDCARGPCTRRCRDPSEPFVPDRIKRSNERSEEHTSELQSHLNLVCRLLLEKRGDRFVRGAAMRDRRRRIAEQVQAHFADD